MAKRRLIKKISEIPDEELTQDIFFDSDLEDDSDISLDNHTFTLEQEEEIETLRAQLESYRRREVEFEKMEEENFRLAQQNQQLSFQADSKSSELEELREKNNELLVTLNKKELEIFELEDSVDSTGSTEEIDRLKQKIQTLENEALNSKETIESLEQLVATKEQDIQKLQQQLEGNVAMNDNEEAMETVKMELDKLKNTLQNSEQDNQDLLAQFTDLQEELRKLQEENAALKLNSNVGDNTTNSNSGRVDELKKELEATIREKSELEMNLSRIQGINDKYSIQKDVFESELNDLREEYQTKSVELENLQAEIDTMRKMSTTGGEVKGDQLAELLQAKQQINDLLLKNQSLQEDALKSQQEIGEVMVSAKKEANRIISEAQVEAKHMINSAELEMLNIGNRAKNISNEVEESKNEVMTIYRELEERLNKISRLDKTNS